MANKIKRRIVSEKEWDKISIERLNEGIGIDVLDLTPEQLEDWEESKKFLEEIRKKNPNTNYEPIFDI